MPRDNWLHSDLRVFAMLQIPYSTSLFAGVHKCSQTRASSCGELGLWGRTFDGLRTNQARDSTKVQFFDATQETFFALRYPASVEPLARVTQQQNR